MVVHVFPSLQYAVFLHQGSAHFISQTYGQIWETFDKQEFQLLQGGPEIERVPSHLFGKEESDEYEMEIWLPIQ